VCVDILKGLDIHRTRLRAFREHELRRDRFVAIARVGSSTRYPALRVRLRTGGRDHHGCGSCLRGCREDNKQQRRQPTPKIYTSLT